MIVGLEDWKARDVGRSIEKLKGGSIAGVERVFVLGAAVNVFCVIKRRFLEHRFVLVFLPFLPEPLAFRLGRFRTTRISGSFLSLGDLGKDRTRALDTVLARVSTDAGALVGRPTAHGAARLPCIRTPLPYAKYYGLVCFGDAATMMQRYLLAGRIDMGTQLAIHFFEQNWSHAMDVFPIGRFLVVAMVMAMVAAAFARGFFMLFGGG